MQDWKALQAGTSHFLGQNFARSSGIEFQTKEETRQLAWTTSWGVSTRLVGGIIMTHARRRRLVLPPRLAPAHAVILPVYRGDDTRAKVDESIASLVKELRALRYGDQPVDIEVDRRDLRGGDKQWEWVKKGVPLRIEIGPSDVDGGTVMVARRDRAPRTSNLCHGLSSWRDLRRARRDAASALRPRKTCRDLATRAIDTRAEFDAFFTPRSEKEIHGGFALSPWCGSATCEAAVKDALSVTIRCIPLGKDASPWAGRLNDAGSCVICGGASTSRVVFAKSY